VNDLYVINADGTGTSRLGIGYDLDWRPTLAPLLLAPIAAITSSCSGHTCSLDGSGSWDPDGAITNYSWSFGDGFDRFRSHNESYVPDGRPLHGHADRV
jgi:hypothetical protein